jgi:RimJ/RimL family protein N-acetyltransferase
MPGAEFLTGDVVSLYTVEEEDLAFLQRWRNHPDVRVPLTDTEPQNAEQMREFFEERVSSEDGVRLLACVSRDRAEPTEAVPGDADVVPVGVVAVPWMQDDHGRAMLSYWIAPPHQGNGYATEAAELLVAWAFAERRLAKVWASVVASNEASRRVLERLGFVEEGRMREQVFLDGERRDMVRYGLLADEWFGE